MNSLPMCGFIAQLVEHRTGIAEVTGSNPVEALIFFRLLLSSCLNWKIHCEDHSSLSNSPNLRHVYSRLRKHGKLHIIWSSTCIHVRNSGIIFPENRKHSKGRARAKATRNYKLWLLFILQTGRNDYRNLLPAFAIPLHCKSAKVSVKNFYNLWQ